MIPATKLINGLILPTYLNVNTATIGARETAKKIDIKLSSVERILALLKRCCSNQLTCATEKSKRISNIDMYCLKDDSVFHNKITVKKTEMVGITKY